MIKPTILTGIRSNEEPTLGNYLGAIAPMVRLQKEYGDTHDIRMFVPDLHSFTTPIDHSALFSGTLHNIKYFIAAGLDPSAPSTLLYRQSYVSAHSELAWILSCFTYSGEMQRMTQFKEKSSEHASSVTMGLMSYPILMAADILLYNARYVPVGEDQFQHLEIARDIATRFNNKFGEIFTVPETTQKQTNFIQRDKGLRIRSLTEPHKKMSKSSADEKSKINLSDTPDIARKKIMRATTDSLGKVSYDWDNQPGICSLIDILTYTSNADKKAIIQRWEGETRYGDLKTTVADSVASFLESFQRTYATISDDELVATLERNEKKAQTIANATLLRAQQAVGLRPTRKVRS